MLRDLRHALRQLVRAPGFTAVAVLTLGLGIGATTALFSLVDAVLIRPLDLPGADRIVALQSWTARGGVDRRVTGGDYRDWHDQSRSFAALASYRFGGTEAVFVAGSAENIEVAAVAGSFFTVLGVAPRAGRPFSDEELRGGGVVLVGDALVRRFFDGNAALALGAPLKVFGRSFRIVGVMPPGFAFPERTEVWLPVDTTIPANLNRTSFNYFALGRLAPGISLAQAQAEMDGVAVRIAEVHPDTNAGRGVRLRPLQEVMVGAYRSNLWIMLAAVGLLLLTACANVANLMLARGARRGREIAVRAALGAGRARIARQLFTESLVLALLGGVAGVLAAHLAIGGLLALAPAGLPGLERVAIDGVALAFASAASLVVCLLVGLFPVVQAARVDLRSALHAGGRSVVGTRGRLRAALVVVQLAVSLTLLVGAGLLGRSLWRLASVELGFRAERLLVLEANYSGTTSADGQRALAFFEGLRRRAAALPGVTAASYADALPIGWLNSNGTYWIEGRHDPARDRPSTQALFRAVGPNYFSTLGVAIREGRQIDDRDTADAPPVVVINRAMARASWPGQSPIGARIKIGLFDSTMAAWMTVVGVVEDTRQVTLDRQGAPELFIAVAQHPVGALSQCLVARTALDPMALAETLRQEARALDPEVPVKLTSAERMVSTSLRGLRFVTLILALFAGAALVLATLGVAGVMACVVAERRAEVGIRMAIGAHAGQILRELLGRALRLTALGLGCGVLFSLAGGRVLRGLLFEVGATDPLTFVAVSALLLAAALAAAAWPALQAARTSPMVVLRSE